MRLKLKFAVSFAAFLLVMVAAGIAGALIVTAARPQPQVQAPGFYLGPSFGIELGGPHASGWICTGGVTAAHPDVIDGISCSLTSGPGT